MIKMDMILSGVGGQGVLSVAELIARATVGSGFCVRQSEVHGMAQRGGSVLSHLRISDAFISGDLVPKGSASLIIAMEPLEALRYTAFLSPKGIIISAMEAIVNIENYPRIEDIYAELKRYPNTKLIDAAGIAKESGNARAVNMVMAGAASRELPEIKQEVFEACIREMWTGRNPDTNIDAFRKGRDFQ